MRLTYHIFLAKDVSPGLLQLLNDNQFKNRMSMLLYGHEVFIKVSKRRNSDSGFSSTVPQIKKGGL